MIEAYSCCFYPFLVFFKTRGAPTWRASEFRQCVSEPQWRTLRTTCRNEPRYPTLPKVSTSSTQNCLGKAIQLHNHDISSPGPSSILSHKSPLVSWKCKHKQKHQIMSTVEQEITLETRGHTAIISLNLPKKLNALNGDHYFRLAKLMKEVAARDDIFITILTGKGRYFSA